MKKLLICLALLSCLFCSCASRNYNDTLPCEELSAAAEREISDEEESTAFSAQDISLLFGDIPFDSCSVVYSTSSDDIEEIGVFHASSENDAQRLYTGVNEYVMKQKEEKSSFVKNYLPDELDKLEGAEAKRFGNYVIYAILEGEDASKVFDKTEKLLKE